MENMSGALGWNDTITKDDEYTLLPAGTYNFEVRMFERGYFNGSEKMSACPQANLTIYVDDGQGNAGQISDSLFLHSKAEWRLSQFFASIGKKKKGEPLIMDWDHVVGAVGKLDLDVNTYTKKDGSQGKNNRVGKYLPYEGAPLNDGFQAAGSNAFTAGAF